MNQEQKPDQNTPSAHSPEQSTLADLLQLINEQKAQIEQLQSQINLGSPMKETQGKNQTEQPTQPFTYEPFDDGLLGQRYAPSLAESPIQPYQEPRPKTETQQDRQRFRPTQAAASPESTQPSPQSGDSEEGVWRYADDELNTPHQQEQQPAQAQSPSPATPSPAP